MLPGSIRIVLLTTVAGCASAAGRGEPEVLPSSVRAAADRIAASQLARDVEHLSSDAMRGRNTPSAGFDSAAAYITRRLQRAGVKPFGDHGTYFQRYELREQHLDTAAAYLDVNGQRFRFGSDLIMRSFAGPVTGTFAAVYVGHGWVVPDRGVDPYAGVDVRGKLLIMDGPNAPERLQIQQVGRITPNARSPFAEALRLGAAGIIFVAPAAALTSWDQQRRANTSRLELHPIVPSAYAAVPVTSVLVRPQVTEALFASERLTAGEATTRGASDRPSFELNKRVTIHVPLSRGTVHRPYNVVAVVEGSDAVLRNEYITIESHLDGAVGTQPMNGDSIYNAADDNATGSAATLAIAEQMMQAPRPKRSLIFIWDSGEERGLWGTRHFVNTPPVPLSRIIAHFNIDMIGATRAPGTPDSASVETTGPNEVYLIGPRVLSARADTLLARANRAYLNLTYNRAYDRADNQFFYPRTDAGPFLERGILTIGYFTGLHSRYHTPRDEARYLDPQKMQAVARTAFVSIWTLANAAERTGIDKELPATVPRYR